MSPQKMIREQARRTLSGNYVCAVAAFVILILPIFIIDGINSAIGTMLAEIVHDQFQYVLLYLALATPATIITAIFLSPVVNGYIRLFYRSATAGEWEISDVFYYFGSGKYIKTLLLNLSFILRMIVPYILAFLPVFIYRGFILSDYPAFAASFLYLDAEFLLNVLSILILVLYSLKYFVVFTLYIENENAEIKTLFRCSKAIMREHNGSATKLIFSFTPWLLLCIAVLPILYVAPYMTQSLCISAKWMMRTTYERTTV